MLKSLPCNRRKIQRVHPLLKIDESLVRISFAVPLDEMVRGKIGCYQITQGSAVKRLGNATFIITPFQEKKLHDKIEQLKKELGNHGPSGN